MGFLSNKIWVRIFLGHTVLTFFMTFLLGNTRTKHNKLPAIIWNFYYDAKKLFQDTIVS